jgi:hypothetical protein
MAVVLTVVCVSVNAQSPFDTSRHPRDSSRNAKQAGRTAPEPLDRLLGAPDDYSDDGLDAIGVTRATEIRRLASRRQQLAQEDLGDALLGAPDVSSKEATGGTSRERNVTGQESYRLVETSASQSWDAAAPHSALRRTGGSTERVRALKGDCRGALFVGAYRQAIAAEVSSALCKRAAQTANLPLYPKPW